MLGLECLLNLIIGYLVFFIEIYISGMIGVFKLFEFDYEIIVKYIVGGCRMFFLEGDNLCVFFLILMYFFIGNIIGFYVIIVLLLWG